MSRHPFAWGTAIGLILFGLFRVLFWIGRTIFAFARAYPVVAIPVAIVLVGILAFNLNQSNQAAQQRKQELAAVKATETAEQAEMANNPEYFTERAAELGVASDVEVSGSGAPKLSIDTPEKLAHDTRDGAPVVYFDMAVNNEDQEHHSVLVSMKFDVDVQDYRDSEFYTVTPEFNVLFSTPPGATMPSEKLPLVYVRPILEDSSLSEIERRTTELDGNAAKLIWHGKESATSSPYSAAKNARNLNYEIIEIDDNPTRNPQSMVDNIAIELEPESPRVAESRLVGNSEVRCWITITNNDDERHAIHGVAFYKYTYTDLGEEVHGEDAFTFGWELDPGESKRGGQNGYPDVMQFPASPDNVKEVRLTGVQFELKDEGLENTPASTRAKNILPVPKECNYKAP